MQDHITGLMDEHRRRNGLLTLAEVAALAETNTIFDPFSTLIARDAAIGEGNTFFPGAIVQCNGGTCSVGSENTFYPSTLVIAANGGRVVIGDGCSLGPGGVQIKANQPGSVLSIGNRARLLNGAEIVGSSSIGDGAQIIGAISAQSVQLAGGDDFTGPDPDRRGAVLKGSGLARGTRLEIGDVVNGLGDFSSAAVERQLAYHPRSK
ncbi:hypothetical protein [Streptomyces sp. AC602_WCS936]|uniref:hypothetical protein n=1 Tax=Streptomyces sp. AC602_WCS936 TaxID=2823685 RepID=UPI001C2631C5|nr:hypothetical protein [Streptomyces sp. AC602_WCS936]